MLEANREAIEAWNTVLFDKFVAFRHLLTAALGAHGDRAMTSLPLERATRVVDIGCGFGDTTIELARRIGPGLAVGIDAAASFVEVGRRDAAALPNVRFEIADIEEQVPGGPYHLAYSRMGTMFFARPVFALRNIRKALVPGGQLRMAVWRRKDANPCFQLAEAVVSELLGHPDKGDHVTCGPGPFSMASLDVLSDQLLAAGFRDPVFARSDVPIEIGRTLDEAIQFALALGPAGEIVRLAGQEGVRRQAEIEAAIARALGPFVRPDGVFMDSSAWIVGATA